MKREKWLIWPALLWLLLFFLIPLLVVMAFAFLQRGTYGDVVMTFTLSTIGRIWDPLYMQVLWGTLEISVVTTILCVLIGYPFAYTVTRMNKKQQSLLLLLVMIPFWINFLVRSYAWIIILRSQGIINTVLLHLGIIEEPLQLLYNTSAVILGMVYTLLPFMIVPIYVAMEQLDRQKLEAAYDLGASPMQAFLHVTLPLTMTGVITGCLLVFVSSIGMFVVSDVMGGSKVALIGNVIQNQFLEARDWPFGSALSLLLVLFSILFMYVYYRAANVYNYESRGE